MVDWRNDSMRVGSTFHVAPPPRRRPTRMRRFLAALGDCALAIGIGLLLFAVFADSMKVLVR